MTRPQTLDTTEQEERALFTLSLIANWERGEQKFFALCTTHGGELTVISVRATSEAAASRKLHTQYRVLIVEEIRTETAHNKERCKFQRTIHSTTQINGVRNRHGNSRI